LSLRFPGAGGPIVLPPDEGLISALSSCLHGWTPSATPGAQSSALAFVLRDTEGTHTLASRHLDRPLTGLSATGTVCGLIADLAQGYCDTLQGGLGLHCGALRFGNGPLLVLTGGHRSGKSTLIAHLALTQGAEVFCDDVLPLDANGQAIALGAAPRLRLPLPDALAATAKTRVVLTDAQYAYLRPEHLAPHGTKARPAVLLALDRVEGAAPSLHLMPQDQAVALLLRHSITELPEPEAALAKAEAVAAGMTCLTLRLGRAEEAAAFLAQTFGPGAPPLGKLAPLPPKAKERQSIPADCPLIRASGFTLRRMHAGLFLWHPDESMLWHLNSLAHALWHLLETPASPAELAADLAQLFPDTGLDQITTDLAAFLTEALDNGLIQPA
jgi:hypothetical protein